MALSDEAVERLADAVKKLMETTQAPRPWYERFLGPLITVVGAVLFSYVTAKVDTAVFRENINSLAQQVSRLVTDVDTVHRWQQEHMRDHVADRPSRSGG